MKCRFNKAQLGKVMLASLEQITAHFEEQYGVELEVKADEFPYKLKVRMGEKEARLIWSVDDGAYLWDGDSLPAPEPESQPDPHEKVGEIKEWQRPEKPVTSPESVRVYDKTELSGPESEIRYEQEIEKLPLDVAIDFFMALTSEEQTQFMVEVWKRVK